MNLVRKQLLTVVCLTGLIASSALGATSVAVFNFQMKSDTPEWVWLEKGLADRITTDLVRDRSVAVVARDRMQLAAQKVGWVAEMSVKDERQLREIKGQLRIEQIVSGVYRVTGDRIEIIAQVVDVINAQEVFRKEIKGEANDVLELQRQLSAELLSHFSGRSAKAILPELPVWTRSLPAAKALYAGMHLYDEGRYAEGWCEFRQASREDPGYVEARYWVGKMYYFMDRYEHARRALEEFVYLDTAHPRMSEAITEYIHTYEASSLPPDKVLEVYSYFRRKFPDVLRIGAYFPQPLDMDGLLREKSADLLSRIGRHRESVVMRPPPREYEPCDPRALLTAIAHNMATGETVGHDVLMGRDLSKLAWGTHSFLVCLKENAPEATRMLNGAGTPIMIVGKDRRNDDRQSAFAGGSVGDHFILAAPTGHVFKTLRFYPVMEGNDAVLRVGLCAASADMPLAGEARSLDVAVAKGKGLLHDRIPRSGYFRVTWDIDVKGPRSPAMQVRGVRVAAELEKLGPHGAIDVWCENTSRIRVEVDGVPARCYPGVIGLLAPGEHTVTLSPLEADTPFDTWTTKVLVEAGRTLKVMGRLPWKGGSPWAAWTGSLVTKGYEGLGAVRCAEPSAIQTDDQAIRIVWSDGDDLWASVSTNGESYSTPARLRLPVSTAWKETSPRLLRDESGRFVLTFLSDRDAQHVTKPYISWSRDLINWSAPAIICDRGVAMYDFFQDEHGRFVLVQVEGQRIRFLASRDAYQWQEISQIARPGEKGGFSQARARQRSDSRYEVFVLVDRDDPPLNRTHYQYVYQYVSGDAASWGPPILVASHEYALGGDSLRLTDMSPVERDGRTLLGGFAYTYSSVTKMCLLSAAPDGAWGASRWVQGLVLGNASMTYHPRWGYVVASSMAYDPRLGYVVASSRVGPRGRNLPHLPHLADGPFVLRGDNLEVLLPPAGIAKAPPLTSTHPVAEESPQLTEGRFHYIAADPWGARKYETCLRGKGFPCLTIRNLSKAPAGCGTRHPDALIVPVKTGGLDIMLAFDSTDPKVPHFNVLRLDETGKGNFKNAHLVLPRTELGRDYSGDVYSYTFEGRIELMRDGKKIPVSVRCWYQTGGGMTLSLRSMAEGLCRFGERAYKVALVDRTGNLRLDDPGRPRLHDGKIADVEPGDWVLVDVGDGSFRDFVEAPVGHPICLNGILYEVKVSADDDTISAKPYAGKAGKILIDHPSWKALLVGRQHVMYLSGGRTPVPLPVDEYAILDYEEWSAAPRKPVGTKVYLASHPYEPSNLKENLVQVADGKTTVASRVGSPLSGELAAVQDGNGFGFRVSWKDAGGRAVFVYAKRPVTLEVVDKQGQVVRTIKRESWMDAERIRWTPPEGLRGTFTVRAVWGLDVEGTVKPTTITIP